ncbi:MAG TPA: hypothetical protein VGH27_09805 [Streptosporangiaceae bacterium]|jgi:hypothetical protein
MSGQPELLAPVSQALLDDPRALAEAARIARAGDRAAILRARRYLDQLLTGDTEHPSPQLSYQHAIAHLEKHARHAQAQLLHDLAQLEPVLADTARRWQDRYAERPATTAEREDHRAAATAVWTVQDEPYAGIDGVLYTPGLLRSWGQDAPVVLAQSRATTELITGFASLDAARGWVRDDRCAAEPRPLAAPSQARQSRVSGEEHVLAGLLRHPAQLGEVAEWLPATTFTVDVRYEIFAAIITSRHASNDSLMRAFGVPGIDQITCETLTRLAASPDWDNPLLGGPATPLATAYLHRLATTPVSAGAAAQAAYRLATADGHALLDTRRRPATALRPAAATPAPGRVSSAQPAAPSVAENPGLTPQVPAPVLSTGPVPRA